MFEFLCELLVGRKIVQWDYDYIVLDDKTEVWIRQDENGGFCVGSFLDVVLDKSITYIEFKTEPFEQDNTYGTEGHVVFRCGDEVIGRVKASADAGAGGDYDSRVIFMIYPGDGGIYSVKIVDSEDSWPL